jgi:hypothetical protein
MRKQHSKTKYKYKTKRSVLCETESLKRFYLLNTKIFQTNEEQWALMLFRIKDRDAPASV